jgi:hypothetical protein
MREIDYGSTKNNTHINDGKYKYVDVSYVLVELFLS